MKIYTVIFSQRAIDDIAQSVNYYDLQQPELGKKFTTQVELILNVIKENPLYFSIRYKESVALQ